MNKFFIVLKNLSLVSVAYFVIEAIVKYFQIDNTSENIFIWSFVTYALSKTYLELQEDDLFKPQNNDDEQI